MNRKLVFSALVAATLAIASADAGTLSPTFVVQVTVQNSCVATFNVVNFGTVTDASSLSASAADSVTCTNVGPVTVTFDNGTGGGTAVTARKMANGANTISYNLYKDAGHTSVLFDGVTGGTSNENFTSVAATANNFTVYGLTAAAQAGKPTGVYQDTITVTVGF